MQITTGIAHGTDVIHSHAGILPFAIPAKENNRLLIRRVILWLASHLPPF
jgi:hypothetical protein